MLGGLLTMSAKELDRLGVIRRVLEGRLPQKQAATMMGMTARQVRRLCQAYEAAGPAGLVSGKRGKPSNRRSSEAVRSRALALVRELYADFGPTLACEKLIQIDGSEHAWFEDRGPSCSLLVFVDDATGRLMELRFVTSESAFAYFAATTSYLCRHGKPATFFSDKHSIFRVAREGAGAAGGVTQFGRALAELNVDIICANTPQAKGRAAARPVPPRAPAPTSPPPPPAPVKRDLVAEQGRHYVIRWVRRQAFLYERAPTTRRKTGNVEFAEIRLGPVDEKVARRWQERGNPVDPPPLAGARVPKQARDRAQPPGPAAGPRPDSRSTRRCYFKR